MNRVSIERVQEMVLAGLKAVGIDRDLWVEADDDLMTLNLTDEALLAEGTERRKGLYSYATVPTWTLLLPVYDPGDRDTPPSTDYEEVGTYLHPSLAAEAAVMALVRTQVSYAIVSVCGETD